MEDEYRSKSNDGPSWKEIPWWGKVLNIYIVVSVLFVIVGGVYFLFSRQPLLGIPVTYYCIAAPGFVLGFIVVTDE